jgi:hypothetical protein
MWCKTEQGTPGVWPVRFGGPFPGNSRIPLCGTPCSGRVREMTVPRAAFGLRQTEFGLSPSAAHLISNKEALKIILLPKIKRSFNKSFDASQEILPCFRMLHTLCSV